MQKEGEGEEEEWDKLQGDVKQKRWYETSNMQGYPVHAPYFPEVGGAREEHDCMYT